MSAGLEDLANSLSKLLQLAEGERAERARLTERLAALEAHVAELTSLARGGGAGTAATTVSRRRAASTQETAAALPELASSSHVSFGNQAALLLATSADSSKDGNTASPVYHEGELQMSLTAADQVPLLSFAAAGKVRRNSSATTAPQIAKPPRRPKHADGPRSGHHGDDWEDDSSVRNTLWRLRHGLPVNLESRFVTALDIVFLVSIIFTCALSIWVWHPGEMGSQGNTPPPWFVAIFAAVEVFTLLWIAVRFCVRVRRGEWDVIESRGAIARHYLSTWFFVDLIYALPIDMVCIGWANRWFYGLLFRHLLRYFRGISIGASVNPLLSGRRKGFNFVSYCSTLILGAHCVACIFYAMESGCDSYVTALYWGAATLSGTGYGDITATDKATRVFAVVVMVGGVTTFSTFTAFATRFLTLQNPIATEKERRKETMHSMLRHYRVAWATQVRVMSCFASVLNRHDERQFKRLTEDLPQQLRDELAVYFHADMLRRAPLFAKVHSEDFLVALASRMRRAFVAPGEFVFREGDAAAELFFIVSGVVEITVRAAETEEVVVATLRQQECFGEGALLHTGHRRSASAQAKAACELIGLTADAFAAVVREYDEPGLLAAMAALEEQQRERLRELGRDVQT